MTSEKAYRPPALLASLVLFATVLVPVCRAPAQEAEKPAAPEVQITAVKVTPAEPAADTLCQLSIELENKGTKVASLFAFTVEINGRKLPVYDKELFALPAEPGAATELRLFNFWSTETGRPAPQDGKLTVEVSLVEAQWVKVETEGDVETWTPVGAVAGLPVAKGVTLKMKK